MRLLITGGCGFVGSNFINYFFTKNQDLFLVNIDNMYYCSNEENVDHHIRNSKNYKLIKGNLQSLDFVRVVLNCYDIDTVIHFAAQSHVDNSFNGSLSLDYTRDNVLATHSLLEACRQHGKILRIIHVSTDEVYGESGDEKKTEKSLLCPTNPYAATKAAAEMIANSYSTSFGLPIIISRGNNILGPHQYPEKLIPKFIKMLKNREQVTIQGDGSCVRSFLHVDDVVRAFEVILEKGKIGEIYNIGGDESHEYTVLQITQKLIKLIIGTEDYEKWITYVSDRPFNDRRYFICSQKLEALGWKPNLDLDTGLKMLLEHLKNK